MGSYLLQRGPLPELALNTNSSAVTAIGNDYGYDQVFARQITALAVPGDVAAAIRTSGNSSSVIQACPLRAETRVVYNRSDGNLWRPPARMVDGLIAVPSHETPRIQECHILIGHALCDCVEQAVSVG